MGMVCMLNTNGGLMKDQVDLHDKTIKKVQLQNIQWQLPSLIII